MTPPGRGLLPRESAEVLGQRAARVAPVLVVSGAESRGSVRLEPVGPAVEQAGSGEGLSHGPRPDQLVRVAEVQLRAFGRRIGPQVPKATPVFPRGG
jgi:hypothetical protein